MVRFRVSAPQLNPPLPLSQVIVAKGVTEWCHSQVNKLGTNRRGADDATAICRTYLDRRSTTSAHDFEPGYLQSVVRPLAGQGSGRRGNHTRSGQRFL